MRIAELIAASVLAIAIPSAAMAVCKEVCDDFGCRFECPDTLRVQRQGSTFRFEIPKASPDQVRDLVTGIPPEAVMSAKRVDGHLNVLIMSVPPESATELLRRLVPAEPTASLPR